MTTKTEYNLELYTSREYAEELNLMQNSFDLNNINGPIPQVGQKIFIPREILVEDLPKKECSALGDKTYEVTRVNHSIASNTKKRLESKITIIAELK
jgi:hypothetical protein